MQSVMTVQRISVRTVTFFRPRHRLGAGPVRGVYDEVKGVYEGKKRRRESKVGVGLLGSGYGGVSASEKEDVGGGHAQILKF